MTREERKQRKRAIRRDAILLALALILIPICAAYLAEWIMPAAAL